MEKSFNNNQSNIAQHIANSFAKGGMPIGTVSKGYKKVSETKWEKVEEQLDKVNFGPIKEDSSGFKVVKTFAAEGFSKIWDIKKEQKFEYNGELFVMKKPNKNGNSIAERISDNRGFRITPFTIVKPL